MLADTKRTSVINQRVRAILLAGDGSALMIKRVKPSRSTPYWVAPGGGVEWTDLDLFAALERELYEELGAFATVLATAFVLEHEKAGKQLEEHFFVCLLQDLDLSKRYGPEFNDPARGQFIPEFIPLERAQLDAIRFQTPELRDWMIQHLDYLRSIRLQPASL
ncbi:MAG: NUDIX domain-containing protein [Chloroflexota bacterium]|nr:NUDIX domain-containing protein [Chloroflexota bacterium]MDE2908787.1 NUDIX domain-containing protein [Chloroflexota bacterium]